MVAEESNGHARLISIAFTSNRDQDNCYFSASYISTQQPKIATKVEYLPDSNATSKSSMLSFKMIFVSVCYNWKYKQPTIALALCASSRQ